MLWTCVHLPGFRCCCWPRRCWLAGSRPGEPAASNRWKRCGMNRSYWTYRTNTMNILLQDLRYGFRMLLKQKGLTAVALLSLALGIGANTALFSIVDAMLLKMLPVKEPDRLVLFRS